VSAPVVSPSAAELRRAWTLDPAVTYLNHGSFGACPRAVLAVQQELRDRLEREAVVFLVRELEGLLDDARTRLATFLGARAQDLVFVPNATSGVNTVLRSLDFGEGDELLVLDHAYNACRNALDYVAERARARVVVARVPFPITNVDDVVEAVLGASSPRTRLALLDHVTSPTGLVLPIERLVRPLQDRGALVLIDGAHAPGMIELDLDALGADFYTGNCHKWPCAPKGAAFLWTREDRQSLVRPLVISHGSNSPRADRSRYLVEGDWTGTSDPTPFLCIPAAIDTMASLLPGGWAEVRRRNRALALAGRRVLCGMLEVPEPSPDEMIGSLASVPLPDGPGSLRGPLFIDPLQDAVWERARIEVPFMPWPSWPQRVLRISAQLYNDLEQVELLASTLRPLLRS